ncbi:aldehyde dehydrogenase family protein [Streptomyces coeruleorubidus]|nr:aldehyde dehydrogenase family protein [Streptomyces coeruleorubidus]WDV49240.1 aldehyde dehydrogenase family protein [Streptomyces coeruleorubidus]
MELPPGHGTRKIGPAIAAGCTMVLKPAPQTPCPPSPWPASSPKPVCRRAC